MTLQLQRGEGAAVGLQSIQVRLQWKVPDASPTLDLDVSIFLLGANGKLPEDEFFVFYNNLSSPDGAVRHTGDEKGDQAGETDEELIEVVFGKLDARIQELVFVVTIHEGESSGLTFGQVQEAGLHIVNQATGEEMMKYELNEDFSIETAVTIGKFVKRGEAWRFLAIGDGSRGGLREYLEVYN